MPQPRLDDPLEWAKASPHTTAGELNSALRSRFPKLSARQRRETTWAALGFKRQRLRLDAERLKAEERLEAERLEAEDYAVAEYLNNPPTDAAPGSGPFTVILTGVTREHGDEPPVPLLSVVEAFPQYHRSRDAYEAVERAIQIEPEVLWRNVPQRQAVWLKRVLESRGAKVKIRRDEDRHARGAD